MSYIVWQRECVYAIKPMKQVDYFKLLIIKINKMETLQYVIIVRSCVATTMNMCKLESSHN